MFRWFFFVCSLIVVAQTRRDVYEEKCKRECTAVDGSVNCWTKTADGFAYGLAAAMADYCQSILKLRQESNATNDWFETSRRILAEQIQSYELEDDVRQLTKDDITSIAETLLNQCFNTTLSSAAGEPVCTTCAENDEQFVSRLRLSTVILSSVGALLLLLTLVSYSLQAVQIRRSYAVM